MTKMIKAVAVLSLIMLASLQCWAAVIEDYDASMQAAITLRAEGNYEAAIAIYSQLLAANPADTDALVGRGFCLIHDPNAWHAAETDFREVVASAPSYIDAYYGLALIYKRSGRWAEALRILELAAANCVGEDALHYLSDISWQVGHLTLARSIDPRSRAQSTRILRGYKGELYLNYTYDWVEDRPDWYQYGAVYVHHPRPDLNVGASLFRYRRNEEYDEQLGLSLSYRHNLNWTFGYHAYLALDADFLARQKHHPVFSYSFPSFTVVSAGLRFDEYDNGWANVGQFYCRQYLRSSYAEYGLLSGRDNFDRPVTTHIVKVGYDYADRLFAQLGYSNGDETVEQAGGSQFSDQLVESLFCNLRYFFSPKWGLTLAAGPEYRDRTLFRTTGSASVVSRF